MISYPTNCYKCNKVILSWENTGKINLSTPLKYYCKECYDKGEQ
jgi:hypothetical protein